MHAQATMHASRPLAPVIQCTHGDRPWLDAIAHVQHHHAQHKARMRQLAGPQPSQVELPLPGVDL